MLRDIFADFNVKVVMYLRRQDLFIESIYTQYVHEGGDLSFEEYSQGVSFGSDYNWQVLVDSYSEVFGKENLLLKVFEKKQFYNGDLVEDFFNTLGVGGVSGAVIQSKNVGYTRDVLELAREAIRYLNIDQKKRMRIALQELSSRLGGRYVYFSAAKRQSIIDSYSESNAAVAEKYFGRRTLFDHALIECEEYKGLSVESASRILLLLLNDKEYRCDDSNILRGVYAIERLVSRFFDILIGFPQYCVKSVIRRYYGF